MTFFVIAALINITCAMWLLYVISDDVKRAATAQERIATALETIVERNGP